RFRRILAECAAAARVVHEDLDPAERGVRLTRKRVDIAFVERVVDDDRRLRRPHRGNLPRDILEVLAPPAGDREAHALASQLERDCAADARARAGDERGAALQVEFHGGYYPACV